MILKILLEKKNIKKTKKEFYSKNLFDKSSIFKNKIKNSII